MVERERQRLRNEWPTETRRIYTELSQLAPGGIFATGIENSDPFVDGIRRNQLVEAYDFTQHLADRLDNIHRLGINWLRFGVGYSIAHPQPEVYDFSLTDQVVEYCDHHGITLIADLLHFGLPEWLHADHPDRLFFQNPEFPAIFAQYVQAFALRYPQIKYFTPVNEPMVTARFSAKDGVWNEKVSTEPWNHRPYVRAVANLARAAILAKKTIRQVWKSEKRPGEPLFFQNESFEFALAALDSGRQAEAQGFNTQRFATTDLIFGHRDEEIRRYLVDEQGLPADEYEWFMASGDKKQTILGIDYYPWSIQHLHAGNIRYPIDPNLAEALLVIVPDYFARYQMPMFHMEVNSTPERALTICQHTFDSIVLLRHLGYPLLGMSWFGDDLQVGWQSRLQGKTGFDEFRVGLFYKGKAEPVASLFAKLAAHGFN